MNTNENEMNRRHAIGLAVACCGTATVPHISAGLWLGCGDHVSGQIHELHTQFQLFNQEIVPQFVDGRINLPTYDDSRIRKFRDLSSYLCLKLGERETKTMVELDTNHLHQQLEELHVRSRLDCSRFDDWMTRHPAMGFLRDRDDKPGHAFASLAWGSTPQRLVELAEGICLSMESPEKGIDAFSTIRDATTDQLEFAFETMDRGDYLDVVEALFIIRPDSPVSLLTLHSCPLDSPYGFRSILSNICGNLMERLANNYFQQTIAIGRLSECNGSWHGFIAGQVFDILVQKWLWLMRGEQSSEPIEMEEASDLSLAMKRGLVEGMLNTSKRKRQSSHRFANNGR